MFFDSKIPRGKLYIKTNWLIKALLYLPFSRLKRGKTTCLLEEKLCEYFGLSYCRTLSSCRMSVYLILKSMKLETGDEVLLTPITEPDIVNAIQVLGLKPVFVDMVSEAQNIDLKDLESKVTRKSRVLLLTYLCGFVPDMDEIITATKKHNLSLIEDITQNYGATYKRRRVGTFGVASVGSFSLAKTITSLGGGFVLTDDQKLFLKLNDICSQSLRPPGKIYLLLHILIAIVVNISTGTPVFQCITYYFLRFKLLVELNQKSPERNLPEDRLLHKLPIGFYFNSLRLRERMPEAAFTFFVDIQSRIALKTFFSLEDGINKRRRLASVLTSILEEKVDGVIIYKSAPVECRDVFWHYAISVPHKIRLDLQSFLLNRGIDTSVYGLRLCSHEPVFKAYFAETHGARHIYESTLLLPIHSTYSKKQMAMVATAINDFFKIKYS